MPEFPTFRQAEDSIGPFDSLMGNKIIDFTPKTASIPAMVEEKTNYWDIAKKTILDFEENRLESYEPIKGKGHWTIGMGNEYYDRKVLNDKGQEVDEIVKPGQRISAQESERLYKSRMESKFIPAIIKANAKAWEEANNYEKASMMSVFWHMGPNAGEKPTTDPRRKVYDALKSPNWRTEFPKALDSFKSSKEAKKGGNGVERRMRANASLFRTKPKQVPGTKEKKIQNYQVKDNPNPPGLSGIAEAFLLGVKNQ